MSVGPLGDRALIRPRPELFEQLTTISLTLDPETRARAEAIGLSANTTSAATLLGARDGHPDTFCFGEVLRVGPGNPAVPGERPGLVQGLIVGFARNKVAHELPTGNPEQPYDYLVRESELLCWFEADGRRLLNKRPHPLNNWVLTRRDAEGARRALRRTTPLTDIELAEGVVTRIKEQVSAGGEKRVVRAKGGLVVERLVDSGPGRWVQPLFQGKRLPWVWCPNTAELGTMIGFMRCGSSARLRIDGVEHSLTPWTEVACEFEEDAEELARVG